MTSLVGCEMCRKMSTCDMYRNIRHIGEDVIIRTAGLCTRFVKIIERTEYERKQEKSALRVGERL